MKNLKLGLALLAMVGLAACDSAVDPEIASESEEMVTMLSSELSLSTGETAEVSGIVADHETDRQRRAPGWSWKLADRLQQAFTEEAKAKLIALTERMEEKDVFGLVCFVGPGGLHGPDWKHRPVFANRLHAIRLIGDLLSEDQIEAIRLIQARHTGAVKALVRQVKAGELTRERFVEEMAALRSASLQAIYDLLTDEQIAALEAAIDERKQAYADAVAEAKRVMYAALDATQEQIDAIETMCERLTTEKDVLFEQHFNGDLSREDLKDALNALNEVEKEGLVATLDDVQMEVVQIHKAILLRWRRVEINRHRDRRDGRFNAGDGGSLFGETTDPAGYRG